MRPPVVAEDDVRLTPRLRDEASRRLRKVHVIGFLDFAPDGDSPSN